MCNFLFPTEWKQGYCHCQPERILIEWINILISDAADLKISSSFNANHQPELDEFSNINFCANEWNGFDRVISFWIMCDKLECECVFGGVGICPKNRHRKYQPALHYSFGWRLILAEAISHAPRVALLISSLYRTHYTLSKWQTQSYIPKNTRIVIFACHRRNFVVESICTLDMCKANCFIILSTTYS